MREVLKQISPLTLYIHILQLEEYRVSRFFLWIRNNSLKRKDENIKPLVWTATAKYYLYTSLLVFAGLVYLAFSLFPVITAGLVIAAVILEPWTLLMIALVLRLPYENLKRELFRRRIKKKIGYLKSRGLKIIGITGSFGKSTTKECLYQMLRTKYTVYRTPGSFNTLFGIEKIVRLELDESYQIFICEMGAYKRGEVAELCQVIQPDYGILTGINHQHLERFGSIGNTIAAKFELVDFILGKQGTVVVNLANQFVKEEVQRRHLEAKVVGYTPPFSWTPLRQNWLGASTLAARLGIPKNAATLEETGQSLAHRLKVVKRPDMTIIDDAQSSNPDGFRAAIQFLSGFPGHKVVITPGIVELGPATAEIHRQLGTLMSSIVNTAIFVGENERTKALASGLKTPKYKGQIIFARDTQEAVSLVGKLKNPTILFENELPDNY